MKDTEITDALRSLDGETELPREVAARIRVQMMAELDRVTGTVSVDLEPSVEPNKRRPTWLLAAAAAVALVVAFGLVALEQFDRETAVTVEVEQPGNHLRACARFQLELARGGGGWFEVLTALDDAGADDVEYRRRLADSLDDLATSPGSGDVSDDLRSLTVALRSDLTPAEALNALVAIEQRWLESSAVRCLR